MIRAIRFKKEKYSVFGILWHRVNNLWYCNVRNAEAIPFSTASLSRSCLTCSLDTRELPTRYSFTFCKTNYTDQISIFFIVTTPTAHHCCCPQILPTHSKVEVFYFLQAGPSSSGAGLYSQIFSAALLRWRLQIIADALQQRSLGCWHALINLCESSRVRGVLCRYPHLRHYVTFKCQQNCWDLYLSYTLRSWELLKKG